MEEIILDTATIKEMCVFPVNIKDIPQMNCQVKKSNNKVLDKKTLTVGYDMKTLRKQLDTLKQVCDAF